MKWQARQWREIIPAKIKRATLSLNEISSNLKMPWRILITAPISEIYQTLAKKSFFNFKNKVPQINTNLT